MTNKLEFLCNGEGTATKDAATRSVPLPRGDWFGMMEAYFDESGIHTNSDSPPKRCVVAGFSGGRQKWISFESEWRQLLAEFRIPAEEGFHSKTFFARDRQGRRRGIYKDWSDADSTSFIDHVAALVGTHHFHGVGGVVDLECFNSLSVNLRRWLTGGIYDTDTHKWKSSGAPSRPYFFAFHQAIIHGAEPAKRGVKVDFIFDRQEQFSGMALDLWNVMKDELKWETGEHLGGISFYSRFERVSLQLADMAAYCTYHIDAYSKDTWNLDLTRCQHRLLGTGRFRVKKLDAQTTDLLLPGYPEELRKQDEELSHEKAGGVR